MTNPTHAPPRRTVLAGALGDPAVPSAPDVAFFLSVPGLSGAATTKGFEGQIELLTWAWGVDASVSSGGGSGGGAGKATPRPVIALAETGIQSPPLLEDTNTGKHLNSALISCVRHEKKPFTFMTLKFEDVLITSYAVTPDPTNGRPLDLIHLIFTKVIQTVFPQKADGSAGTPVVTTFDYARSTAG